MSKQKDGGAAFPVFDSARGGMDYQCYDPGMTLRDWFAGQVLAGMLTADIHSKEKVANFCYGMADAMIAEREKQNDT